MVVTAWVCDGHCLGGPLRMLGCGGHCLGMGGGGGPLRAIAW